MYPPGLGIEEMLEQQAQAASVSLAGLRDEVSTAPADPMTDTAPSNHPSFNFDAQVQHPDFNFGVPAHETNGFVFGAPNPALPIPPVVPSNGPSLDYGLQASGNFNFGVGATSDRFAFGAQTQNQAAPVVVPSNNHDVNSRPPAASNAAGSTAPFTFGSQSATTAFTFGAQTPQTSPSPFTFTTQLESTHPQIPNSFDFGAQTESTTSPSNTTPFTFGATTQPPIHTPTSSSTLSTKPEPGTYRNEASQRTWELGSGKWVTEEEYYARLSYEPFMGGDDEKV